MTYTPPQIELLYARLTSNTSSNPATGALLASIVANERPASILEIGRYAGVSTAWMHWACPDAFIESFDPNPQDDGRLRLTLEQLTSKDLAARVLLHKAASPDFVGKVRDQFDVILIDGDHRYPGVARDLDAAAELLRAGGLIIMHDVLHDKTWPAVRAAFYDYASRPAWASQVLRTVPNKPEGHPCGLGLLRRAREVFSGCQTGGR